MRAGRVGAVPPRPSWSGRLAARCGADAGVARPPRPELTTLLGRPVYARPDDRRRHRQGRRRAGGRPAQHRSASWPRPGPATPPSSSTPPSTLYTRGLAAGAGRRAPAALPRPPLHLDPPLRPRRRRPREGAWRWRRRASTSPTISASPTTCAVTSTPRPGSTGRASTRRRLGAAAARAGAAAPRPAAPTTTVVAITDWLYRALRRAGQADDARALLAPIDRRPDGGGERGVLHGAALLQGRRRPRCRR